MAPWLVALVYVINRNRVSASQGAAIYGMK